MRRVAECQSVPRGRVRRAGFTLIELLIVISIVSVLMAVLLPTLHRVRKQARAIGCRANLRQSGVYFAAYAAEHDGSIFMGPWDKGDAWKTDNPILRYHQRWMGVVLGPSLDRKGLLLCPSASKPKYPLDLAKIAGEGTNPVGGGGVGDRDSAWSFACRRTDGSIDAYVGSFGFNVIVEVIAGASGRTRYPTVDIREAPQMPVLLDCGAECLYASRPDVGPPPYEGYLARDIAFPHAFYNRHEGGVNCLFLDWSVRKVGLKEFWTLKWDRNYDTRGPWTKAGGVQPEDWPEWMRGFKDY